MLIQTLGLNQHGRHLGGLVLVHGLDTLDLFAVLEDDDGGEFGELEVLLGGRKLLDVDLVGDGVGLVLLGGPICWKRLVHMERRRGGGVEVLFSSGRDLANVGEDENVFLLDLEGLLEVFLALERLVDGDGLLDVDGGHCDDGFGL
jgi:hypothetical protein